MTNLFAAGLRLWERARRERCSPREVGWAVAVGVFSGCTPLLGLHMWMAMALATLLGLNRLWALAGSRISFTPVFAGIAFCEIELAHRLRTGVWAELSPHDAIARGKELLGDWLLGTLVVGAVLSTAFGLAAYLAARRWHATRRGRQGKETSAS